MKLPPVREVYREYSPPLDVRKPAERILASVPSRHLAGLSAVVLTNAKALSYRRRRQQTRAGSRKVPVSLAIGLYHPADESEPAWIELFVDRLYPLDQGTWTLKLWGLGEWILATALCHEIGHHIHFTQHPEHADRERVADRWADRLRREWFWKRWWYLYPLVPLSRWLVPRRPRQFRGASRHRFARCELHEDPPVKPERG
jgi:hypothetical protein